MQRIRPTALSSFARKISYVFIFCGLLLCYLVVSMRQTSVEYVNESYMQPRVQIQIPDEIKHPIPPPSFNAPLPPGNVRPIQDLLMHQAQTKEDLPQANNIPPAKNIVPPREVHVEEPEFKIEEPEFKTPTTDMPIEEEIREVLARNEKEMFQDAPKEANEKSSDKENKEIERKKDRKDMELHVFEDVEEQSNYTDLLFKDFKCGNPDAEKFWCTVDTPEDIMEIKLPPFLKNYKNPCWKVQVSEDGPPPIRCLPYFFLVGAPKSGTTDLFERMIQHPQISSQVKKEIHWFSRRRYAPRDFKQIPQYPMFVNYTDMFKEADTDLMLSPNAEGYHDKIFGDSSVSTLWDNMNAVRYSILTDTQVPRTAECIHHLNPNTKFVSIIRDPVERTYSDFLYFGTFPNKTKAGFHEAVTAAINFEKLCLQHYSLRDCIDYRTSAETRARLNVAIYHHHFEEFFKFFPKEQFIILKLEDYSKHMPESLAKVFSFLGLDPLSDEQMKKVSDQSTVYNTRPSSGVKLGDMWPETRMLLNDFFKPFNDELGKLLGEYYNYNKKTT